MGLVVRFEEGDEWSLGRDPDEVTFVLEDPLVSRKHGICRRTHEGYLFENLSTVNPATQNGRVIAEPSLLYEGDILQLGNTFFRFTEHPPEETPALVVKEPREETLRTAQVESIGDVRWMIKVVAGPNSGAEFGLHKGTSYVIGTDPYLCDILFQDLSVSRQHARIGVDEEDRAFVEDLGSRNGVLINGALQSEKQHLASQDIVALGTTSFLVIDREQEQKTIISPPPSPKVEALPEGASAEAIAKPKKDWRDIVIPTKHMILIGFFAILFLVVIVGLVSLMKTETIVVELKNEDENIKTALADFKEVQFIFIPATGKIFLSGHVLTAVDKEQLLYQIRSLPFIVTVEDAVIIDEYVWENMNALLIVHPEWTGVSIHSPSPGKFVVNGYVQTVEQSVALNDYLNIHFPYLDRLENKVVVEVNLQKQISSILIERGFSGVTFQLVDGELVLSGMVNESSQHLFQEIIDRFKAIKGIRNVKNYVIYTTAITSRIDISSKYIVTGTSKRDEKNWFVVIKSTESPNGKILSVGEILDGMTITAILPHMVLLENDGLKFRINYNLQ